jgi:hypothetical protein
MGTDNAAIAHVVVLLEKREEHKKLEVTAAMLEADEHVDQVVEELIDNIDEDAVDSPLRQPAKKRSR